MRIRVLDTKRSLAAARLLAGALARRKPHATSVRLPYCLKKNRFQVLDDYLLGQGISSAPVPSNPGFSGVRHSFDC
jgi:hypothetical protein